MSQTPIPITGGTGTSSVAAELVSGTSYQQVEIYGGGGASVMSVNPDGSLKVSVLGTLTVTGSVQGFPANQSVSGTIGASIIGAVPIYYSTPASMISGVTSVITGLSSVQVLAPAPGGQRNYITNLLVTNAAATGTVVYLYDGGNVLYAGYAAASGGGFSLSMPSPLKQSSIAGNLSAMASVQASIIVSASGYTAP